MAKTLVFTATYNESDNIASLIHEIKKHAPAVDIIVVDDASPDGTGLLVEELAKSINGLSVIHRPRKAGVGSAHMLAMKRAVHDNYDYLITMDADFSHHPKYLPEIIAQLHQGHDFVIGSRYTTGGKCDYGFLRQGLSRGANKLAILLLGLPLSETTTSYRGLTVPSLKRLNLDCIRSTGYSFFIEFVYRISKKSEKLVEIPIHFEDRRAGKSKISKVEILNGIFTLIRLATDRMLTGLGLRKTFDAHITEKIETQPCPICNYTDCIVLFHSNTTTGHDGAQYQCTNTHHGTHGQIIRCLGCGLISTNPQMPSEKIQALYADVEDTVYLENVAARQKTFRYNLNCIKGYLPSSGKLLDIGAYCGVFMETAAQDGYESSGVEPSRWASKHCQDRGLNVHCGTLQTLTESARNFDVITCWDVLEHVSDPIAELKEINRRLRLGGVFALSTLHVENWFPRLIGERWPWYMDMHLYYFTNNILKYMLEQNGFEVIYCRPYCHVITGEYLIRKIGSLGIPFIGSLSKRPLAGLLKKIYVPFRIGDIQLTVARKVKDVTSHKGSQTTPESLFDLVANR